MIYVNAAPAPSSVYTPPRGHASNLGSVGSSGIAGNLGRQNGGCSSPGKGRRDGSTGNGSSDSSAEDYEHYDAGSDRDYNEHEKYEEYEQYEKYEEYENDDYLNDDKCLRRTAVESMPREFHDDEESINWVFRSTSAHNHSDRDNHAGDISLDFALCPSSSQRPSAPMGRADAPNTRETWLRSRARGRRKRGLPTSSTPDDACDGGLPNSIHSCRRLFSELDFVLESRPLTNRDIPSIIEPRAAAPIPNVEGGRPDILLYRMACGMSSHSAYLAYVGELQAYLLGRRSRPEFSEAMERLLPESLVDLHNDLIIDILRYTMKQKCRRTANGRDNFPIFETKEERRQRLRSECLKLDKRDREQVCKSLPRVSFDRKAEHFTEYEQIIKRGPSSAQNKDLPTYDFLKSRFEQFAMDRGISGISSEAVELLHSGLKTYVESLLAYSFQIQNFNCYREENIAVDVGKKNTKTGRQGTKVKTSCAAGNPLLDSGKENTENLWSFDKVPIFNPAERGVVPELEIFSPSNLRSRIKDHHPIKAIQRNSQDFQNSAQSIKKTGSQPCQRLKHVLSANDFALALRLRPDVALTTQAPAECLLSLQRHATRLELLENKLIQDTVSTFLKKEADL